MPHARTWDQGDETEHSLLNNDYDFKAALANLVHLAAYACRTPTALIQLANQGALPQVIGWGWERINLTYPLPIEPNWLLASVVEVPDTQEDLRFADHPLVQQSPHIRFYASAPLLTADGRCLGTLCVIDYHPRTLEPGQQDVLRTLAKQVVLQLEMQQRLSYTTTQLQAIRREAEQLERAQVTLQQSIRELEVQHKQTRLLNQLNTQLQSCTTFLEAHAVLVPLMHQIIPGQAWRLFILDPDGKVGKPIDRWDDTSGETPILGLHTCPALQEFLQGKDRATVCDGPRASCCQEQDLLPTKNYRCLPLSYQNELVGLLQIAASWGHPLPPSAFAYALADQLALIFRNLKLLDNLKVQSIRDPLTGLFNRRYLTETLERLLQRCRTGSYTASLIMIDLDHFKRLNDTFGHLAGDSVLKDFSVFIKGMLRTTDLACRYGGEEFILILPGTTLEVATKRADKLRRGIKYLGMEYEGRPLGTITVSVGVATAPQHGATAAELIETADMALYQAKMKGRDRVVSAKSLDG